MTRPFTADDADSRFKLVGTKDREWGLLEFPLDDPGSLTREDAATTGVLWFSHNPRMPHTWRYVTPADVEPVRPWFEWPHRLTSEEPVPFHRRLVGRRSR